MAKPRPVLLLPGVLFSHRAVLHENAVLAVTICAASIVNGHRVICIAIVAHRAGPMVLARGAQGESIGLIRGRSIISVAIVKAGVMDQHGTGFCCGNRVPYWRVRALKVLRYSEIRKVRNGFRKN